VARSRRPSSSPFLLNGEHPGRAEEAVRLYRAGVGREVWLTDDPKSAGADGDAGTRSNLTHLVQHGSLPRRFTSFRVQPPARALSFKPSRPSFAAGRCPAPFW